MAVTQTKSSKAKGKEKSTNTLGAPAQHSQSSRKGKKAWRKNVNIGEVEEALEGMRAEERITGKPLQSHTNDELFQIDVTGDPNVRKSLPRFSTKELTSAKIIAQRSAVPAVFSRPSSSSSSNQRHGPCLSHKEKIRLLRTAKKNVKGPLNSVLDPTEMGSASMDPSHAVKESGSYDVWESKGERDEMDDLDFKKALIPKKAPAVPHPRSMIGIAAVAEPHQGTSYNPPLEAHQELLKIAHEAELVKEKAAEKLAGVKEAFEEARKAIVENSTFGVPLGMIVDEPDDDDEEAPQTETPVVHKPKPRKTKQQRNKEQKLRAEKKALAETLAKKRLLASINGVKSMRSELKRKMTSRSSELEKKREAQTQKLKMGLANTRLGRHKIQPGNIDVQLGEELSESLRAMKPEGNLFRDRFLSLQHRALAEPRVPVLPNKRGRARTKQVEKFAWKRFE